MSQAVCTQPLAIVPAEQQEFEKKPDRIVIIIEAGKVVWFDTAGRMPPTEA